MCVHQNKSIIINHFVNDDSLLKLKVENLNFHSLNINQCIYISNIREINNIPNKSNIIKVM